MSPPRKTKGAPKGKARPAKRGAHKTTAKPKGKARPTTRAARKAKDPLYEFCRSLPGVTEDVKWGNDLVFSVGDKMFVVFGLPEGEPFGFKVDAVAFEALTRKPGIVPAPYMARHSWINVASRRTLPAEMVTDLIKESHALVAAKLSRRVREQLGLEAR